MPRVVSLCVVRIPNEAGIRSGKARYRVIMSVEYNFELFVERINCETIVNGKSENSIRSSGLS